MNNFEYKGFSASVEFSSADELLVGKIADIDSLIMFSADNIADLAAEFKLAVDNYIAHCEEAGIEPLKPYKGTFNVRVGADAHRKLASIAKKMDVSLNEVMRRAAEDLILRHGQRQAGNVSADLVYVEVKEADVTSKVFHLQRQANVSTPYEGPPVPEAGRRELRGKFGNPYDRHH